MGPNSHNQNSKANRNNTCPWQSKPGPGPDPFSTGTHPHSGIGTVIRRTILFQIRLAADGLRDLLLSPICLIAALLGVLNPNNPGWALDRLMAMGRQSDRWINLFEQESMHPEPMRSDTLDDLCETIEEGIKSHMQSPERRDNCEHWQRGFSAYSHPHQEASKQPMSS